MCGAAGSTLGSPFVSVFVSVGALITFLPFHTFGIRVDLIKLHFVFLAVYEPFLGWFGKNAARIYRSWNWTETIPGMSRCTVRYLFETSRVWPSVIAAAVSVQLSSDMSSTL
jgi:hypothetical protein